MVWRCARVVGLCTSKRRQMRGRMRRRTIRPVFSALLVTSECLRPKAGLMAEMLSLIDAELIRRAAPVSHTIEQAQQALTLLNTTLETVLPRPRRAPEEEAGDPDEES
jgi:hypothetical protein